MLLELTVTDLALIERVRVAFGPGFTVITGETGAGKSLLIDALGLVSGARSDPGLVRAGTAAARVEALFDRVPEPLICAREVSASGRSIARMDDETVTAARLAEVVGPLVEIHGQHEQGRLVSAARQRVLLDAFGGHQPRCVAVRDAVRAWRENDAALAELATDPGELDRRIELHEHAAREIEEAAPEVGESERLRATVEAAANAQAIGRLVDALRARISGEGSAGRPEGGGAQDMLARAARDALELGRLDPRFGALAARLEGLSAELDDSTVDLARLAAESEHDPVAIGAAEERLGRLYALFRKYGDGEAALVAHGEAARAEAERLRGLEGERERRAVASERLEAAARALAADLSVARRAAAVRLARDATAALASLGFAAAVFDVLVTDAGLDASGADSVAFTFAPNTGEPAAPLARIASGGELSRVALAIETVLAAADATPTLVFDEVDAGIGGRSADPVGGSLWRLARDHQVICITHLPQIAAHADAHLQISKRVEGERTTTHVRPLEGEERIDELAAMLGGTAGDAAARAAARELLARARASRAELSGAA